ncbi:3-hydroxyacyl-CoA dehydrogenase NAD-binding domain-containing protein [Niveispirillum sp. BGYR6]|uniref:3-hydroxyacyl-CoA dehydrogenase NAD-binding domain-containing protein n=1 Tax=Niveispirillum sp. BGYR6 TaxID=2971249 RepID=UPI0022B98E4F|nr:3-hydroxyacyl-CoA dehydrogenase NAD-binding domain-containing protein [Niveispirillum sp. BGYR6]MDG5493288.1 3-hydroxyacyl-CoA dehydrogenase NAD-binding domain-containing protein [Niveispirillum sp. BGYR6]
MATQIATLSVADGIATIIINAPPVNALSAPVRLGLVETFTAALADDGIKGIILACAGKTFFAGADITELGKGFQQPDLHAVQAVIEGSNKPVVAAIHGTALGGGLEVALTCNYRVAVPSAKVGLPEVALGLLPGAGGTQRLPRVVGPAAALDIMVFGKPLSARKAFELGLIDALVDEGGLHAGALAYLRQVIAAGKPLPRVRDREDALKEGRNDPGLFDRFRAANARAFRGFKAPENIIRAVEAAVTLPFEQGIKREWELFLELLGSTQSAAQRYAFFAERGVGKIPDLPTDAKPLPISRIGVIGAGTMGGGIAMNFLNSGLPVTIVERAQESLDRGIDTIRRNYANTVAKGRLSETEMERRMALLTPTLDMQALAGCDLVIEAVFENIDLKKQIFATLDGIAAPHAILASNTSFLDLDAIAAVTARPQQVIGLHFFSPANVMRLLEVVRGRMTSPQVLATALQVGRVIGKVTVVSGVCDGFIANRMMAPRTAIASDLTLRGPLPWEIDRVMTDYGFPMGPFAMMDLVGLDVIGWNAETSRSATLQELLCEAGHWGQKRGRGYYDYDDKRRAQPSAFTMEAIEHLATKAGIERRPYSDDEILEHLLYPVINEGARILREGIAFRGSDVDIALIYGYGWPVFTGGPLFWADTIGLDRIVAGLEKLRASYGDTYAPDSLLRDFAAKGLKLHKFGA